MAFTAISAFPTTHHPRVTSYWNILDAMASQQLSKDGGFASRQVTYLLPRDEHRDCVIVMRVVVLAYQYGRTFVLMAVLGLTAAHSIEMLLVITLANDVVVETAVTYYSKR